MDSNLPSPVVAAPQRRFDWLHVVLLVLVVMFATAAVTVWLVKTYVFPSEFQPVTLNANEEHALDAKLDRLDRLGPARRPAAAAGAGAGSAATQGPLEPEPYSEVGAKREIALTERELNGLLAKNTDLARRLAIDLSGDLVSAKLLVPVDPDFPILGGQTLKVRAGVELAYRSGKPVVVLRGVSLMGVPLPSAWIGGLKNIDLVQAYGGEPGFWRSFADGVEDIRVEERRLVIKLKE